MNRSNRIRERLQPERDALLNHPVYGEIRGLPTLRIFMEHHIFAVWDFMSLLKALQARLTCVAVPWLPTSDGGAARLINEIVLAEESDEDGQGGFVSHFELYRRSMIQCGASIAPIDQFLDEMRAERSASFALESIAAAGCVRRFVGTTFDILAAGNVAAIASAFTFGREDLLPEVFLKLIESLDGDEARCLESFRYYLRRHIELDQNDHGPVAIRLLESLCGDDDDEWDRAERAAKISLQARLELWDGVYDSLVTPKESEFAAP